MYILTSEYLQNNITISGNTILNSQFNTLSVFTASNVSSPCVAQPSPHATCQGAKAHGHGALHGEECHATKPDLELMLRYRGPPSGAGLLPCSACSRGCAGAQQ